MSRRGVACLAIVAIGCVVAPFVPGLLHAPDELANEGNDVTIYQPILVDDFEDIPAGNPDGLEGWSEEAAGDDLAIVVAGSVLAGVNCLRVHDQDNTNQASLTKTLPCTIGVGDIARICEVKPVASRVSVTPDAP